MPNPYDQMQPPSDYGTPFDGYRQNQMAMMNDIFQYKRKPREQRMMEDITQYTPKPRAVDAAQGGPYSTDRQRILRGLMDSYENMGQENPPAKMQGGMGSFDLSHPMYRGGMF
jgi:hypothetical protein